MGTPILSDLIALVVRARRWVFVRTGDRLLHIPTLLVGLVRLGLIPLVSLAALLGALIALIGLIPLVLRMDVGYAARGQRHYQYGQGKGPENVLMHTQTPRP